MTSAPLDPWQGLDGFEAGYLSGYLAGIDRGRELADAEAAALHRQAWHIVQAAARIPSHEDLERQRRERALAVSAADRANAEPLTEPDQPTDIVRASLAAARTPGAAA